MKIVDIVYSLGRTGFYFDAHRAIKKVRWVMVLLI